MSSEFAEGAACIPNLGRRERGKRQRLGVIFGVVTAGVAAGLIASHAPRVARIAVFVPAVIAAYGFAQARAQT